MYARGFALRGRLSESMWREFLVECAQAMGMSPVAKPASWAYPIGGAGGNGTTIVQPITESFLALDTWPDHDGAYLFVCSCKSFYPAQLRQTIALYNLDEGDMTDPMTLSLEPRE